MASATPITSRFLDQLLAPLPESEEQVVSPRYTRHLTQDWARGMDMVEFEGAGHRREALGLRYRIIGHTEHISLQHFRNYIEAQAEQCLIPAPTLKELRWKRRLPDSVLKRPEVMAAIARDEARLESAN